MVTSTSVKVVRAFLGLSQDELAKGMNVSTNYISAIEDGTARMTAEYKKKFKRAVGVLDDVLMDIEYLKHKMAR